MKKSKGLFTLSAAIICACTMTACGGGTNDDIKNTNKEKIELFKEDNNYVKKRRFKLFRRR